MWGMRIMPRIKKGQGKYSLGRSLGRSQRKKRQLEIAQSSHRELDAVKLLDQGREEGDDLAYKVISRNDLMLTRNLEATAMLQKEAHLFFSSSEHFFVPFR